MTSTRRRLVLIAALLLGTALGCAQLESDNPNAPAPAVAIAGPNAVRLATGQTITAKYILVATGGRPSLEPAIPGGESC